MLSQNDLRSVIYMIYYSSMEDYPYIKAHAQMEIDIICSQSRDRMMTDKELCAFEYAIATITHINLKELSVARRQGTTQHLEVI